MRGDASFASGRVVGVSSLVFAGPNTRIGSFAARDLDLDVLPALRNANIAVFVWTINDELTMRALIEADVSGIVTDFPQRLAPLLKSKLSIAGLM